QPIVISINGQTFFIVFSEASIILTFIIASLHRYIIVLCSAGITQSIVGINKFREDQLSTCHRIYHSFPPLIQKMTVRIVQKHRTPSRRPVLVSVQNVSVIIIIPVSSTERPYGRQLVKLTRLILSRNLNRLPSPI